MTTSTITILIIRTYILNDFINKYSLLSFKCLTGFLFVFHTFAFKINSTIKFTKIQMERT